MKEREGRIPGIFPHLVGASAFVDVVDLALWGVRRIDVPDWIEQEKSRAIGGPGRAYARCIRGRNMKTGNRLQFRYGKFLPYRNVSPFALSLRSDRLPVTCADVMLATAAFLRQGYRAKVSRIEVTFDVKDIPLDIFARELCTTARTFKEIESGQKQDIKRKIDCEARLLVRDPFFLYKAGKKIGELGVVGEKRNRLILTLAGIARTFPDPPSVLVKGSTSSGKSTLVRTSLKLFPPNCILERAGLSKKALAHGKVSLAHKILFISEYQCGKDSQQLLSLLQSEGSIAHEFTTIRGAERGTKTAQRVGSPVVLSTTTDEKVFADDETRFLSIFVDESPAQNQAIVLARAQKPRRGDAGDLPIWQQAMSLLAYKKGDFEHPPKWIEFVAKRLPLDKVRVRRDWDRFLKFCSAVALLRTCGATNRTDISFEDYCIAYRILEPVFASTLHGVRTQAYVLGSAVAKLHKRSRRAVTVQEIVRKLGWKQPLVYKYLKIAIPMEPY